MFAAYVLGPLGSRMKNVALSISTVLFSEETIDTNHPSDILTNAGPDDLMKARSAAEPSCKFHPSSRPYAPNDMRSSVSRRFRLTHVGLRDLDLELRERLSDGGNVRFDAWSFVSLDEETSPRPQHHGTLNMREREREREREMLTWHGPSCQKMSKCFRGAQSSSQVMRCAPEPRTHLQELSAWPRSALQREG